MANFFRRSNYVSQVLSIDSQPAQFETSAIADGFSVCEKLFFGELKLARCKVDVWNLKLVSWVTK